VDITFAPFLERIAASILYYKGMRIRGSGLFPALDAWFAAMMTRPVFVAIQSDFYTHAHDLPPQLGGCEFNAEGPAAAAAIDGTDGVSWRLPLPPLSAASLEAYEAGDAPEKDRLEAAARLVGNAAAVVRFAARGCGTPGARPVSAPLADPTARPGEAFLDDVDAALRRCAHALIAGTDAAGGAAAAAPAGAPARKSAPAVRCFATTAVGCTSMRAAHRLCALTPRPPWRADAPLPSMCALHQTNVHVLPFSSTQAAAAAYLRDRVGVPRDMRFPAARQLRAHLNWVIDGVAA
jgi:glutathione S-transferase